jgi:hypothetical protein
MQSCARRPFSFHISSVTEDSLQRLHDFATRQKASTELPASALGCTRRVAAIQLEVVKRDRTAGRR